MPSRSRTESSARTGSARDLRAHERAGPRGALDREASLERPDPVGQPAKPEPAPGSAPPAPSSRTSTTARPSSRPTSTVAWRRRVLGHVGQRLRDDEIGRRLDGGGSRSSGIRQDLPGAGRVRPVLERAPEPAVGQDRRVDAARELAELRERRWSSLARARGPGRRRPDRRRAGAAPAEPQRQRDQPLLGAVVQVALQPPALAIDTSTSRAREVRARRHARGAQLRGARSRARAAAAAAARTRSSLPQRGLVDDRADALPSRSTSATARPDRARARSTGGPPRSRSGPPRRPVDELERRVAERVGEALPQAHARPACEALDEPADRPGGR